MGSTPIGEAFALFGAQRREPQGDGALMPLLLRDTQCVVRDGALMALLLRDHPVCGPWWRRLGRPLRPRIPSAALPGSTLKVFPAAVVPATVLAAPGALPVESET